MRQRRIQLAAAVAVVAIASVATVAVAGGGMQIRDRLTGDEEVPVVLTGAEGKFKATISSDRIDYELRYEDLEGSITQAHIHIGQRLANGGISVWLCGNPSATVMPPAGTQTCPASPATITGTIMATNVVGPANQGIAPGEFDDLVDAIRDGFTYANVHTSLSPGGEIRGQLNDRDGD
jgi:CHRD domain